MRFRNSAVCQHLAKPVRRFTWLALLGLAGGPLVVIADGVEQQMTYYHVAALVALVVAFVYTIRNLGYLNRVMRESNLPEVQGPGYLISVEMDVVQEPTAETYETNR
jgi:hypothetical protein